MGINCDCCGRITGFLKKLSYDYYSFPATLPRVAELGTAPPQQKPPGGGRGSVFYLTDSSELQRDELGAPW